MEEVQDEAFQEVGVVVAVPQSLGAQHGGVLSHEGHGGPAASETSLDGACHLVGRGEDVSVHDQDVQPPGCLLMEGHVLQPQEALVGGHGWRYSRWEGSRRRHWGWERARRRHAWWRKPRPQ